MFYRDAWADELPETLDLTVGGVVIHVLHDRKALAPERAADLVITGHSHKPGVETVDGVTYLNPGSAGPRRFSLPVALALVTIAGSAFEVALETLAPDAP